MRELFKIGLIMYNMALKKWIEKITLLQVLGNHLLVRPNQQDGTNC